MADELVTTPAQTRRKGGRPTRALASAKALSGVDLTAVDPVAILREIAADRSQPGSTRVVACRALLGQRGPDLEEGGDATKINERAVARMRAN
jgi:hypothetical protein